MGPAPPHHDEQQACPLLLGHQGPRPAHQTSPRPHRHRLPGQDALLRPGPGLRQVLLVRQQVQPRPDFPNLPYYIDGDVKITQSNAILRHIARKHDMLGKNDTERAMVDMMADESMDFRNGWVRLCYNPDFDNLKEAYLKGLTSKLQRFSNFLATKSWFAGDSLTFVDFVMYELIDQHKLLAPDCLKPYANLEAFQERFEALPKVSQYMKSSSFMKSPINNKMAKFGF